MVNKAILVGRLGGDPEVRETQSGKEVANFNIATDETRKGESGDKVKHTCWHKIVVWDKLAGIARQYLKKGDLVFVEGRIQNREYETNTGERKTVTEIIVNELRMLGGNSENKAKHSATSDEAPF